MNFIFKGHQLLSLTGEAFCKTAKKLDEKGCSLHRAEIADSIGHHID